MSTMKHRSDRKCLPLPHVVCVRDPGPQHVWAIAEEQQVRCRAHAMPGGVT